MTTASATAPRRAIARPQILLTILFFGFAWMTTVGLNPLADRSAGAFDEYANVGSQQYIWVYAAYAVFSAVAFFRYPTRLPLLFDPALILFFVWAAITVRVSLRPGPALIDLVKQLVFLTTAAGFVLAARDETNLLRMIKTAFLIILVLDIVAVANFPTLAIHQINDAVEGNIAGAWRGLHDHKNKFGELAALTAAIFLCEWRWRRRPLDFATFLFCCVLAVKAKAKTAVAAVLFSYGLAELVLQISLFNIGVGAVAVLLPLIGLVTIGLAFFLPDIMLALFGDTTFSGRTVTWRFLWDYAHAHKWMGSGFSSFFIGKDSPLYQSGDYFLMTIGNAHNSFLDILVTTGVPGLALVVAAFIVAPVVLAYRRLPKSFNAWLWLTIVIFLTINCATSIVYFQPQRAVGLMLAIAYFALRRWRMPWVWRPRRRIVWRSASLRAAPQGH